MKIPSMFVIEHHQTAHEPSCCVTVPERGMLHTLKSKTDFMSNFRANAYY